MLENDFYVFWNNKNNHKYQNFVSHVYDFFDRLTIFSEYEEKCWKLYVHLLEQQQKCWKTILTFVGITEKITKYELCFTLIRLIWPTDDIFRIWRKNVGHYFYIFWSNNKKLQIIWTLFPTCMTYYIYMTYLTDRQKIIIWKNVGFFTYFGYFAKNCIFVNILQSPVYQI